MSAFDPLQTLEAAATLVVMQPSVTELADAWIALQRYRGEDAPHEVFQRGFRLNDVAYDDPAFALSVIEEVVSRYDEKELFTDDQTPAKHILANLGAGPLETLLAQNGSEVISKVEAIASTDPRFRWVLGCVWQHGMSEDLWARVQFMTGGLHP